MQQPSSGSNPYVPGFMYSHNNNTGENAAVIGNNIIHSNVGNNGDNDDFDEWAPNRIAHVYNNLIGKTKALKAIPFQMLWRKPIGYDFTSEPPVIRSVEAKRWNTI